MYHRICSRKGVPLGDAWLALVVGCISFAAATGVSNAGEGVAEGEYQLVVQAHGPRLFNTTDGCLLLMDEPAQAAQAMDIMRTPEMVAEEWGDAATAHHGVPTNVQFGVAGKSLLAGEADRCAYFDGSARLAIADAVNNFNFSATNRFSFGVRLMTEQRSGPGEWSVVSRMHDGSLAADRGDDRGWRLVLVQTAGGTQRLRFDLTDSAAGAGISAEAAVDIVPGMPYTVVCTYLGNAAEGGLSLYVRGEGVTTHAVSRVTGSQWNSSGKIITGGTLRLGGDNSAVEGFRGWMSGFFVEPRTLAIEDAEQLHHAAVEEWIPPMRAANLGIIRDALRGRCFGRVVGDSTSVVYHSAIPRRLAADALIPRRNAVYKNLDSTNLPPPAYASFPYNHPMNVSPGGIWSGLIPANRGYASSTVFLLSANAPDDATVLRLTDGSGDVLTDKVFPRLQIRMLYPRLDNPSVSPAQKLWASNGVETQSVLFSPRGADTLMARTDLILDTVGQGTIDVRIRGTNENETSTQFGVHSVFYMNADSVVNGQPGLWWAGATAREGATTAPHLSDAGYYAMSNIRQHDAAMMEGVYPPDEKVVFVLLTINDGNGNVSPAAIYANFQTIAARWRAEGYKICFIQPWVCYYSSATGNPQRIPLNTYDQYWNEAFLPMAGDDVAVVSLHQWFRGVPYQFLEATDTLPWSIHASGNSGAIRALIPLSRSLKATPYCFADFNGVDGIDVADLFAYINAWLAKAAAADVNGDSGVDVADLFAYINGWLAKC